MLFNFFKKKHDVYVSTFYVDLENFDVDNNEFKDYRKNISIDCSNYDILPDYITTKIGSVLECFESRRFIKVLRIHYSSIDEKHGAISIAYSCDKIKCCYLKFFRHDYDSINKYTITPICITYVDSRLFPHRNEKHNVYYNILHESDVLTSSSQLFGNNNLIEYCFSNGNGTIPFKIHKTTQTK